MTVLVGGRTSDELRRIIRKIGRNHIVKGKSCSYRFLVRCGKSKVLGAWNVSHWKAIEANRMLMFKSHLDRQMGRE